MSYGVQVLVSGNALAGLDDLSEYVRRGEFKPGVGTSVVRLISRHLVQWNASHPNRLGGKRTNIIAHAAEATRWDPTPDGVAVTISNPAIGARFRGAEIRPVRSKFLTIPARPEAYGKSPREFNLRPVFPKNWSGPAIGWLESAENYLRAVKSGKRKGQLTGASSDKATHGEGGVLFWLVKRVTILPEPEILPPESAIAGSARSAVLAHLRTRRDPPPAIGP